MKQYQCMFFFLSLVALGAAQMNPPALPAQVLNSATLEKAKVFIRDSESWQVSGSATGANGAFAAYSRGGARPQTAEIIKTFGERCPEVIVNNREELADYIVLLDHEGGKGVLRHRNKVAVFGRVSGDVVVSHSTLSLGNSVKDACEAITDHWVAHGAELRSARDKTNAPAKASAPEPPNIAVNHASRLLIASTPDGADIEIDGSFVGNTPSMIEISRGEHQVIIKKSGYTPWTRKLKVTGGDIKLNAELEKP